jgi:uncharacterized tellurite resistance protein B-like protein
MTTQEQLVETVQAIKRLEAKMQDSPDLASAVELNGHYEVAQRLAAKVEEAEDAKRAAEAKRLTASLRERYDLLANQLEDLYSKGAGALRQAIDTLEEAYVVKQEVRRLWSMLAKRDARPGVMPNSFWPRDRKLRDDFTDSVLRNGEP